MSLNSAEKKLVNLNKHIRVCDSHDINSCVSCIQLITQFLDYVGSLDLKYQTLSAKNKKNYRNLVRKSDELSMIKKDKEKIVNDYQIKIYRTEFIKAFNIQWNIITKTTKKYPKKKEDNMIYKYHVKPTLDRLRNEDWFPNRKQYIQYLEKFEADVLVKDLPDAVNTPLVIKDPRLPTKDESFYKYGKRVLKDLKKLHPKFPIIFVEVLNHISPSHAKMSESTSILDYRIRFYNLRNRSPIPEDKASQFKDDIYVYITNLNKLKLKLLLLSDRSESLYKKFVNAPALSLRGGNRSKKVSKKKNIKKKSIRRKNICI
mgnify:CR=1 FL=1|jgi:hypothetical protein